MLSLGIASGFASGLKKAACGMTRSLVSNSLVVRTTAAQLTSWPLSRFGVKVLEDEQLVRVLLTKPDPFVILVMS